MNSMLSKVLKATKERIEKYRGNPKYVCTLHCTKHLLKQSIGVSSVQL
jgi:transcription initiation factor IIE alpha subunit